VFRCRHVRDLLAVAARIEVDRSHAHNDGIGDVLRGVVLRAFMGEKSRRNGHTGTPLLLIDRVSLL
jgi:hypothetical protein